MTPDEARAAVADQATVRLHYRGGGTRAVGRIISYSIVPEVCIELADGTRESWRHDMAEVVSPAPRRCWRIDVHPAHEWQARPDEDEGGPRQTVTCPGHVVTEGGHWTRCPGCGTSGRPHLVGGVECRETAREKAISQGDE